MKTLIVTIAIILFVGFNSDCRAARGRKGQKQVIEQEIMELMKKMDVLDERARMKLLSSVDEQRHELLGVLLKHLGTSSSRNVQAAAIYLIGRHRLSDGVNELIRRIDFDTGGQLRKAAEPLWERYPAMEALITIGKPSVAAAIELLATEGNDLRRTLAVKVIRYVENGEVATFVLERAHAKENDPNRKTMLDDALTRLSKLLHESP